MRRALVALNTELAPPELWRAWLRKADLVVGADGGGDRLLALGIEPDAVVGDLDSLLGSSRRRVGPKRIHLETTDDTTDLEKALDFVEKRGIRDVTIVGGKPGRLDHVMGQMAVLLGRDRPRLRYIDDDFLIQAVRRRVAFRSPVGTVVSLLAPAGARGVTTKGLRWRLTDATLPAGTRGLHNEVVSNPVDVLVGEGGLLLFRSHGVEPHR